MRLLFLLVFTVLAQTAHAQLRVGADAGAGHAPQMLALPATTYHPLPKPVGIFPVVGPGTRVRAASGSVTAAPDFDFAAAKPHLAFFCRLELDIEEATRFPVRFRLGEVRTWQQELSKRD